MTYKPGDCVHSMMSGHNVFPGHVLIIAISGVNMNFDVYEYNLK